MDVGEVSEHIYIQQQIHQTSKKYPQKVRVQPENPRQNVFPHLRVSLPFGSIYIFYHCW